MLQYHPHHYLRNFCSRPRFLLWVNLHLFEVQKIIHSRLRSSRIDLPWIPCKPEKQYMRLLYSRTGRRWWKRLRRGRVRWLQRKACHFTRVSRDWQHKWWILRCRRRLCKVDRCSKIAMTIPSIESSSSAIHKTHLQCLWIQTSLSLQQQRKLLPKISIDQLAFSLPQFEVVKFQMECTFFFSWVILWETNISFILNFCSNYTSPYNIPRDLSPIKT